ncbi:1003_t:CDS:2, partial [Entrophospora sp. SA101]
MPLELSGERRIDLGSDHGDRESHKTSSLNEKETYEEEERPLKYKIIALLCVLSLALGSHYAGHALDALKAVIKTELGISNSQYGVVQSSVTLVNTILPILGGVFIDIFGTLVGSVLATSLIAIGNILVALSTDLKSFAVMVIGRILYGLGSGPIVIVQVAILSNWFRGKGLAIAVGIQIAVSRLSSFLANLTVIPIAKVTGELVKIRWNKTDETAAYDASIAQFLPIFISPFLGFLLDRFGHRSLVLIVSAVFLVISMGLLGFTSAITPIIGMICFSISLSFGPVTTLSTIPVLLPMDYVGTGLGFIKSTSNVGSTIYNILVGLLQDLDKGMYGKVMIFYLTSSILAIIASLCLYFVSKKWYDNILDMKESERKVYYKEKNEKDRLGENR